MAGAKTRENKPSPPSRKKKKLQRRIIPATTAASSMSPLLSRAHLAGMGMALRGGDR